MIRRALVIILAILIAVFRLCSPRQRAQRHVPITEYSNAVRARGGSAREIAEAQAEWMRRQVRVTSTSITAIIQRERADIRHYGDVAASARGILDELESLANEHPEGVSGPAVAEIRLRYFEASNAGYLQ